MLPEIARKLCRNPKQNIAKSVLGNVPSGNVLVAGCVHAAGTGTLWAKRSMLSAGVKQNIAKEYRHTHTHTQK